MNEAGLTEAYARLNALKSNLPESLRVEEKYIREFDDILSLLEKASGTDLRRFRPKIIPTIRIVIVGKPTDSKKKALESWDRNFLMMKIDGVLNLFALQMATPKPIIGFNPPK